MVFKKKLQEKVMMNKKSTTDNTVPVEKDNTRAWLALGVPALSMFLLIVISSIYLAKSLNTADAAQTVFNTTLPLIGTWVGTVLAFYFTSHNFDAAAKNARDMVDKLSAREKLQMIIFKDVWIPMENAVTVTMDRQKGEKGILVKKDMIDRLERKGRERLPILDIDGKVRYVAHRSMIDRFAVKCITEQNMDISLLTLADMLADEDAARVLCNSYETFLSTANLADVKDCIDNNSLCSDVFATEDGTKKTKALGWVTNVIVAEKSQL
jgi:hypothetical protein